MQYLLDKNDLLHHCITDKDRYINVVMLYTEQDLKYRLVVKEERYTERTVLHLWTRDRECLFLMDLLFYFL